MFKKRGLLTILIKMMVNNKIVIGFMILIIILSVGSILITFNLDSDDVQTINIIKKGDTQTSNIGLSIQATPKNEVEK